MKHTINTIALIGLSFFAQGQPRMADAEINLTDSLSTVVLGETAKELPEILINAFKKGELKAYVFGFQKQLVYGELKQWPHPKAWVASDVYDKNDSVSYKGKLYKFQLSRTEFKISGPTIAPDAYGINDYWKEYKPVAPVVTTQYILPAEKDLLRSSRWAEINATIVLEEVKRQIPTWQPDKDYYQNERVFYQYNVYEAQRDNKGILPTNKESWVLTNTSLQPSEADFTQMQFVFNRETRMPVALELKANSLFIIGFIFSDVKACLVKVNQSTTLDRLENLMQERMQR